MKLGWFFSLGIASAIALSACSGSPVTPTTAPASVSSPASGATTAPNATTAPTIVPTTPPTMAPTIAPASPTAAATATTAAQPTKAAAATPEASAAASTPAANGPSVEAYDVQKVGEAWSKVKSFRIKSEAAGGAQFQGDFVAPDRSHVTVNAAGQNIEIIRIGTDTYTKINGNWTKRSATPTSISADPSKLVADFNNSKQTGATITKGAVISVNGVKCQEWVSAEPGGTTSTICIGVNDSLPYQVKSGDGKSIIDIYDYNAPITIKAPI